MAIQRVWLEAGAQASPAVLGERVKAGPNRPRGQARSVGGGRDGQEWRYRKPSPLLQLGRRGHSEQ